MIFAAENRQQNEIIGMVSLLFTISTALGGKVAILEDMIVDSASRGTGIGSCLIESALSYAAENDFKRITLLTDADNSMAQRFYKTNGFYESDMKVMRR